MQYPFAIPGKPDNGETIFPNLPAGVLSLQGLPTTFDTRGVEYATYICAKNFGSEDAAYAGFGAVIDDWLRVFSGILEAKKPTAVEWRRTPVYEVDRMPEGGWRGQVYARFSLHDSLDPLDNEVSDKVFNRVYSEGA